MSHPTKASVIWLGACPPCGGAGGWAIYNQTEELAKGDVIRCTGCKARLVVVEQTGSNSDDT